MYMDNSEFVFTQTTDENGNKIVIGGGYKIDSFFLKEGNPIMTTYNNQDINNNKNKNVSDQDGGKKISTPFENLAVPAGIFYVNQKVPKISNVKTNYDENHNMLPEDIYDKLLSLVQPRPKKKDTRKNKKSIIINEENTNIISKKIQNKSSKKTRKNK